MLLRFVFFVSDSLPEIEMFLLNKEQVDVCVVPACKGIVKACVFDFGSEEPSHPLCKLKVILVFSFGKFLYLS